MQTMVTVPMLALDPDLMDVFEGHAAPIVMMDPPEHTVMRRLVSKPMTPSHVGHCD